MSSAIHYLTEELQNVIYLSCVIKKAKVVKSDSIYIGRCICRLISYFKEPIFFACIVQLILKFGVLSTELMM